MLEEKRFKRRVRMDPRMVTAQLEKDIDHLVSKELWKELEELEDMMAA
ncbi:MAG: hypothetical protein JW939_09165 [Candidatus Thermoplasmatota archaeon]|nr:hypothetical protein [Candidatus Thermoplasmatota archaeon]